MHVHTYTPAHVYNRLQGTHLNVQAREEALLEKIGCVTQLCEDSNIPVKPLHWQAAWECVCAPVFYGFILALNPIGSVSSSQLICVFSTVLMDYYQVNSIKLRCASMWVVQRMCVCMCQLSKRVCLRWSVSSGEDRLVLTAYVNLTSVNLIQLAFTFPKTQ